MDLTVTSTMVVLLLTTESQDLGMDEVEIDFLINVGNVSGVINFDAQGDPTSDQTLNLEQAHITYNINDSVSVTFGRYGSALGLRKKILQVFTQSLELIQTVTEMLETLVPVQLIKEAVLTLVT